MLIIVFVTPASSQIYKYTDKNGNTYYSDSPPSGVKAEEKKFREQRIERPEANEHQGRESVKKFGRDSSAQKEKRDYRDINVVMYMTSWCAYCRQAREYISSLGVSFIEYNIEDNKRREEEMLTKSGGGRGVPLIDVEGIIIRGYSPEAIKAAVEKRRNL